MEAKDSEQPEKLTESTETSNTDPKFSQILVPSEKTDEADENSEEESNEVLEAKTIYVLMSKQFRLSRNARAQWYLSHLRGELQVIIVPLAWKKYASKKNRGRNLFWGRS